MTDALRERVAAWIAADPDPDARAELQALLDREADEELARALRRAADASARPGCAARLGAGPARMNVATVRQASAGLAAYLLEASGAREPASWSATTRATARARFARGGRGGLLRRRPAHLPPAAARPDAAARLRACGSSAARRA